jgi:hypothetical protein
VTGSCPPSSRLTGDWCLPPSLGQGTRYCTTTGCGSKPCRHAGLCCWWVRLPATSWYHESPSGGTGYSRRSKEGSRSAIRSSRGTLGEPHRGWSPWSDRSCRGGVIDVLQITPERPSIICGGLSGADPTAQTSDPGQGTFHPACDVLATVRQEARTGWEVPTIDCAVSVGYRLAMACQAGHFRRYPLSCLVRILSAAWDHRRRSGTPKSAEIQCLGFSSSPEKRFP